MTLTEPSIEWRDIDWQNILVDPPAAANLLARAIHKARRAAGRVGRPFVRRPVASATVIGLIGLGIQVLGYAAGWTGRAGAIPAFFAGMVVLVVPHAWVLVGSKATRQQRFATGISLALLMFLSFYLSGPLLATRADETLHAATLMSLLRGRGFFAANGMLPVSPYYPGLELATSAVFWVTGFPAVVCQAVVIAASRVLLVTCLFLLVERRASSERAAGLAVLIYCASTQFYFFNAQFAYQTLAIALFLALVYQVQRALDRDKGWTKGRLVAAMAVAGTLAITHHLTSFVALPLLWAWFAFYVVDHNRRGARILAQIAVPATLAVGAWTVVVGPRLYRYLTPLFAQAESQLISVLTGKSGSRRFFSDAGGYKTPSWQEAVMLASVLIWLALAFFAIQAVARKKLFGSSRMRWLPTVAVIVYPALLAGRVSPMASAIGDRTSTFVFMGMALVIGAWAAAAMGDNRPAIRHLIEGQSSSYVRVVRRPSSAAGVIRRVVGLLHSRLGATAIAVVLVIGGVLVGGGPEWGFVPGKFLPGAEQRSITPTSVATAKWIARHFPAGSRFAADTSMNEVIPDFGDLVPVTATSGDKNVSPIFYSRSVGPSVVSQIRQERIDFLVVDTRLIGVRPQNASLYEPTTAYSNVRLTYKAAYKFNNVPGFMLVHRGPIAVFDTRPLLGVPRTVVTHAPANPGTSRPWEWQVSLPALAVFLSGVSRRFFRPDRVAGVLTFLVVVTVAVGSLGVALGYSPVLGALIFDVPAAGSLAVRRWKRTSGETARPGTALGGVS